MIIPGNVVEQAMKLGREDIVTALKHWGYETKLEDLLGVRFIGMNGSGQFIYELLFQNADTDSGLRTGQVFVDLKQNNKGLYFVADY